MMRGNTMKENEKSQEDSTKNQSENTENIFDSIPMKLSTYTDHSADNAEKRNDN